MPIFCPDPGFVGALRLITKSEHSLRPGSHVPFCVLILFLVLVGCGGTSAGSKRQALLRVSTEPTNARVFIDDIFVATGQSLSVRPRRLKPGKHLLTVEAPDYFPHDLELELPPGETKVDIKLRPVP